MKKISLLLVITLFIATPFLALIPTASAQAGNVTFVMGNRNNLFRIDPIAGEGTLANEYFPDWMYETLYKLESWDPDAPGDYLVPWLVESELEWRDGIAINLTLRQGIKFWNGMDWNASVLQWNMHRQRDMGMTFYGQASEVSASATIQRFWYNLDTFMAIPGNAKYNDSSLYPELWWNKDTSRYPPEYYDGTNTTVIDWVTTTWPANISLWEGRGMWFDSQCYNHSYNPIYPGSMYYWAQGNYPGNNHNVNSFNNVTLDPDDPYKCTVWLTLPVWSDMKAKGLWVLGMIWPKGATYDSITGVFADDGLLYYPGASANPDYVRSPTMSVKGPSYSGEQQLADWANLIGTGPFRQTNWDPIDRIMTFVNYTDYWGGNWVDTNRPGPITPAFDTFVLITYDTDDPHFNSFLEGEMDYCPFGGSAWADWRGQIESTVSTRLIGPFPVDGVSHIVLNPMVAGEGAGTWPPAGSDVLDYTLRYAMSFAFQYDHFLTPAIYGGIAERNMGPFWGGRLYTEYVDEGWHPTFPRQSQPGFSFNLTEARYLLVHNDTEHGDRATSRGLDMSSADVLWQNVASGPDPIANMSMLSHASFPEWFTSIKTYMSLIGINVDKWEDRDVPTAEYYPGQMIANRYSHHMKRSDFNYAAPTLFDPIKWHLDDIVGDLNLWDPTDHYNSWNMWVFRSSDYEATNDWVGQAGPIGVGYNPTVSDLRQLIHALPFVKNDSQKTLDYGTIMDVVYKEAISIWIGKPVGYGGISRYWGFGGRKETLSGGAPLWDFRPTGWTPPEVAIPGFPAAVIIAFTLISALSIAIVIKKRRI